MAKKDSRNIAVTPGAFTLFAPSWEALKVIFSSLVWLFMVTIVPIVVLVAVALIGIFVMPHGSGGAGGAAVNFVSLSVGILAVVGLIYMSVVFGIGTIFLQLQGAKGKKSNGKEAFKTGQKLFWRFLGLSSLVGLIVMGGFILLIIPGIFLLKRYYLSSYYLVDKNLSISDAMKLCAKHSAEVQGVWGLMGVTFLIQLVSVVPIIGAIANLVGSVAYYCAPAVRYQQIQQAASK